MVDYKEKIKQNVGFSNIIKSAQIDHTGTYLFFSLDIVNSTFFKNKIKTWADIFAKFFKFCKAEVSQIYFPKASLWKMVGDEILFYMPISNLDELYRSPEKIFDLMGRSIQLIHENEEFSRGILSVKATMWAAYVEDIEIAEEQRTYNNVIIKERVLDNINLDFLGPDIDIGFRISKFALQNKLVIDSKLACLLTKLETDLTEDNISERMRIISYERLKGVWDNRHYPIVWYQKKWEPTSNMFLYDERFNSEIVKKIVESNSQNLEPVSFLTKIFSELNKLNQIEDLRKGVEEFSNNNPTGTKRKKIPSDRLSELHLVAICVNEKEEILISKRTKKDDLPNKWEFGCAQLHLYQTFSEAMQECYKNDFGLDLSFWEETPTPIGQYTLTKKKEENRVVPGLIFVASVVSNQINIEKIDATKHSEIKWVTLKISKELGKDDCVPDFHKRIEDTYSYVASHKA
jgi:hypothetical protein